MFPLIGPRPSLRLGTLVLALATLAGAPSAQSVLGHWVDGGHPGFGAALSPLGDVNGDGRDDVLVVADPGGEPGSSAVVLVISGRSGSSLHTFHEPSIPTYGQTAAGIGDVDGDGLGDIAIGSPDHPASVGTVYVYSGLDGRLLHEVSGFGGRRFGTVVAGLDDVDGDGHADLLVGAPATTSPSGSRDHQTGPQAIPLTSALSLGPVHGRVFILSGADGSLLREIADPLGDPGFGRHLAPVGDVNGDGVDDFAVVAHDDTGGFRVRVHSGASGFVLRDFPAGSVEPILALSAVGDVNRDQRDDVLFFHGVEQQIVGYSGKTGALVVELPIGTGTTPPSFTGVGDIDIDLQADLLVRRPDGRVEIVSIRSHEVLFSLQTLGDEGVTPTAVARAGDLDGDGFPDMVVGHPGLGQGSVTTLSGHRYWSDVGQAIAGTYGDPKLTTKGNPEAGELVTIKVSNALESRPVIFLYGRAQMAANLLGGILVPMPNVFVDGLFTDVNGELTLAGTWPAGLPTPSVFFIQVWISDPAGIRSFAATNGIAGALH